MLPAALPTRANWSETRPHASMHDIAIWPRVIISQCFAQLLSTPLGRQHQQSIQAPGNFTLGFDCSMHCMPLVGTRLRSTPWMLASQKNCLRSKCPNQRSTMLSPHITSMRRMDCWHISITTAGEARHCRASYGARKPASGYRTARLSRHDTMHSKQQALEGQWPRF